MKKILRNKKGFTLAELLIVVAIIAVLVAIAIPIFTAQLEKARDAVTAANLRSAYAEAAADVLTEKPSTAGPVIKEADGKLTVTITGVKIKGTKAGGVTATDFDFPFNIAGDDFGKQPANYDDTKGVAVKFTYAVDKDGNVNDVPSVTIVTATATK